MIKMGIADWFIKNIIVGISGLYEATPRQDGGRDDGVSCKNDN